MHYYSINLDIQTDMQQLLYVKICKTRYKIFMDIRMLIKQAIN